MPKKITSKNPIDLLITHVEIRDSKAIRCGPGQTPQEQYVKDHNREVQKSDRITAYIFGRTTDPQDRSYCVEVPYNPTCYLRVPHQWEVHPEYLASIFSSLLETLVGSEEKASGYQGCLTGKFVRRLHAFGYRPEPYYLFLQIKCSNRVIYRKLKSKLSSSNTFRRRTKWHNEFYQKWLTRGFLARHNIDFADIQDVLDYHHNPKHQFRKWYTPEWFVAHEFLDDKIAFLKSIKLDINGFVRVQKGTLREHTRPPKRKFSNAAHEIVCSSADSIIGVDLETIPKGTLAPIVKCTFDIECASHDIVNHPLSHRALDKVSQIGTKTQTILDSSNAQNITFTLGKPALSTKTQYRTYRHETELLVGFAQHIVECDVDIFNTFNGLDYDWDYLHKRACLAQFVQTTTSFEFLEARWSLWREQYCKYQPLQTAYTALITKYKTKEEQEDPNFQRGKASFFKRMAAALDQPAQNKHFRQPLPSPFVRAVWAVPHRVELRKFYDYFRVQPPITPWFYMHRMKCDKIGFDIRHKSSAALGNQYLKSPADGRTQSDMYLYIKTAYAMDKYGLDACADKFLKNQSKDNLLTHYAEHQDLIELRNESSAQDAYRMMYEYVASGHPELLKAVCEYCAQDVEVTDQLDMKLGTSLELVSMMKRYRVVLQMLTLRAQQYRFMTNVAFEIMDKFVFNSYDRTAKAPTYQGAAVLPPKWGLHGAPWEWVFCLDFASLYPTIMRERNFCIRTFILPCDRRRILELVRRGKHPPLMAVPYAREYLKNRDPLIMVTKETPLEFAGASSTAFFAKMETQDTILPQFLERMGNDRNAVKKEMKLTKKKMSEEPQRKAELEFQHMVLDSEQKAIKIGYVDV